MRFLIIIGLSILSFIGTLVCILAITGNLSSDAIKKLVEPSIPKQSVQITQSSPQDDSVSVLIEQIKKKEEDLRKKEEELNKKEEEIKIKTQELEQMQTKVESIQKELSNKVGQNQQEKSVQMQTIATTLSGMKPDKAAERLKTMSPEEIAEILSYVKPKERGKIVEALDAQLATQVLQALQKVPTASPPSS